MTYKAIKVNSNHANRAHIERVCVCAVSLMRTGSCRVAKECLIQELGSRFGEKIGGLLWERFAVHYTPKHGSWLNQAEIEISLFSRQCLGQRRIPSLRDLRREARAWNRKMNRNHVTINWQFTRKKARQKFGYDRNNITPSET